MNKIKAGCMLIISGLLISFLVFLSISIGNRKAYNKKPEITISEKEVVFYEEKLEKKKEFKDPFSGELNTDIYGLSEESKDKVFAVLEIPSINMKAPIRLGASEDHLLNGLAHVEGSSLPIGGDGSRSLIAGHRGMRNGIMFAGLGKVKVGDNVILTRKNKVLKYKVNDIEIIYPTENEKVDKIKGRDILSLITCEPLLPPRDKRLLVNCERVKDRQDEIVYKTRMLEKKTEKKLDKKQGYSKIDLVTGILGIALLIIK